MNIDIDLRKNRLEGLQYELPNNTIISNNFTPGILAGVDSGEYYVTVKKFSTSTYDLPFVVLRYEEDRKNEILPYSMVFRIKYMTGGTETFSSYLQVGYQNHSDTNDIWGIPRDYAIIWTMSAFISLVNACLFTLLEEIHTTPNKDIWLDIDQETNILRINCEQSKVNNYELESYHSGFNDCFTNNGLFKDISSGNEVIGYSFFFNSANYKNPVSTVYANNNHYTTLKWVQSMQLTSNLPISYTSISYDSSNNLSTDNLLNEFSLSGYPYNEILNDIILYQPEPTNWLWFKVKQGQDIETLWFRFFIRTLGYEGNPNLSFPMGRTKVESNISLRFTHESMLQNWRI